MAAHFNRSTVSLYDISLFAPALKDIPYDFSLEGDFNGTVSDFSVTDLHIGYGRSSQFVGTLTAQGLPEIDSTSFSVVAQKIVTNQFDLSHTRIPPFNEEDLHMYLKIEKVMVLSLLEILKKTWFLQPDRNISQTRVLLKTMMKF